MKLRVDMEGREHLLEIQRNGSDSGFKITWGFQRGRHLFHRGSFARCFFHPDRWIKHCREIA